MAIGTYACHIHHGGRNDKPRDIRLATTVCYQLCGLFSGMGRLTTAAGERRIPAPCGILMPAGGGITLTCPAASRWEYLMFDVSPVPLLKVKGGNSRAHEVEAGQPSPQAVWGERPPIVVPPAFVDGCLDTVRFCGRHWWVDHRGWARANARLHWWLTEYACAHLGHDDQRSAPDDPWLAHVREIADSGIETGMTATDLARSLGISRELLRLRLGAMADVTPGSFLLNLRMERAMELMVKRRVNLASIARLSGYRSLPAFSAAFKRHHGCPPGVWRRRIERTLVQS